MKNLKICLHKLGIGNVKGDNFLFRGILAKSLTHLNVLILKESDALGGVDI